MLPLIPIQYYTLRHRKNGYICRSGKLGFDGSHVGALCNGSCSSIPIEDHRNVIKLCCCRQLQVDWQNIILCDLDRNIIKLPALGKCHCGKQMIKKQLNKTYCTKYEFTDESLT